MQRKEYGGECSSSDDDDSDQSESFDILCDSCDSSFSSVSLEDLEEGTSFSDEDEPSSSDSSYSLPVAFGKAEDDDDDEEEEDEDIMYILNKFGSNRSMLSKPDAGVGGGGFKLSMNDDDANRRFKIRDQKVEKCMTTVSTAATTSNHSNDRLPVEVAPGPIGGPKRRRRRRRSGSKAPPHQRDTLSRSGRSQCSQSTCSIFSCESIDEERPTEVERRPSMSDMVLHDLADEGLTDDELEESLRYDCSSRSTRLNQQLSPSISNNKRSANHHHLDSSFRSRLSSSQRSNDADALGRSARSHGTHGTRSILSNGNMDEEIAPRRPSMGEMVLHDLEDEGISDDELEESLRQEYVSWQHQQNQQQASSSPPSTSQRRRGRKKQAKKQTATNDDDEDETDSRINPSSLSPSTSQRRRGRKKQAKKQTATTNDDDDETDSHINPSSRSPSTSQRRRGRNKQAKKQTATTNDDDDDETDSSTCDSDCWSESLPDDANKIFSEHLAVKKASTTSRFPINLRRDRFTSSQRKLGISDHGTIHFDSTDDDDSSIDSFGGESSSIEYTSAESESDHDDEEEDESSLIDHSTRAAVLALVSPVGTVRPMDFHNSLPDMSLFDEEEEEAANMEESFRTSTLRSQISRSHRSGSHSDSSEKVLFQRTKVRNNLQRLDAHMFKVFGQSAPDLSQSTRSLVRASLAASPKKTNQSNNKKTLSERSNRSSFPSAMSHSSSRRSKHSTSINNSHHSTISVTASNRSIISGSSRTSSSQNSNTAAKSLLRSPNSKSTSSLLETKRSHADLSRQKLREAFGSLGLGSLRASSRSLCSRE